MLVKPSLDKASSCCFQESVNLTFYTRCNLHGVFHDNEVVVFAVSVARPVTVTTIHINDLHLKESLDGVYLSSRFDLKTMVLESMPCTRCAQQIVDCLGAPQHLRIIHSGLISIFLRFSPSHTTIQEIDKGKDLVGFIQTFFDRMLVVKDCPGFNDEVLHAMDNCTPELQDLSILNCPNISIPALKRLVATRCLNPRNQLRIIRISGCVPEMSLEAEWFNDCLFTFSHNQES
jgi:hypothetical protein